jgi:gamma-glutamyltranspeptidase/glutathione hydrolase
MCASNEPTASAIGAKVLEAGGNAADAAVAIASALNVLQPNMCGLGGDSFALFYDAKTKSISCLQGNGASSANLTLERANEAGFSAEKPWDPKSGMCVTVPGAAALWDDLVKTHGSLPLSQILSYAIKLADEGFPISPITSATWAGYLNAEGERVLRPHGRVPHAGEIIRNPDLAQTLRSIAEHGAAKGYYQGRVAEAVVAAVQAHGGVLDLQDLASHKTKFVQPISVAYKGLRIYETPPPSQGLAALIALRLIEKVEQLNGTTSEVRTQEPLCFDANYAKRSSVDDTHLALECMRVACAEALHHITDPLVQSVPVEELLSDAFITAAAQKISPTTSTTVRATDYEAFQRGETAYFCAADRHGNACSMISSNFQGFGTGIMPINCGFTLQNRGMNFSLQPGHPNQVMPNKRPYHTIIPAMVTYDSDNTLFGVMGCMVSALSITRPFFVP